MSLLRRWWASNSSSTLRGWSQWNLHYLTANRLICIFRCVLFAYEIQHKLIQYCFHFCMLIKLNKHNRKFTITSVYQYYRLIYLKSWTSSFWIFFFYQLHLNEIITFVSLFLFPFLFLSQPIVFCLYFVNVSFHLFLKFYIHKPIIFR